MPVFTAAATAVVTAVGGAAFAATTGGLIATSVVAAGLAYGVGKLTGAFDTPDLGGAGLGEVEDPGVEVRLGANTQNHVPALYGQWTTRGIVTYFEVSEDRQKLHTVITLGEGAATSIDRIYIDEFRLTLNASGEITSATAPDGTTTDRFNNGRIIIHTYLGGSNNRSTYLEGESTAWTASHKMTGLVYAVVTVNYNRDHDITGLPDMRFIGTSPNANPADAVQDQLTNSIYGLGLPSTDIDTASFAAARAYYDSDVTFTDRDGNTSTGKRFQINGAVNTADNIQSRIESMLDGSNSSLRWTGGKWGIFVNRADTIVSYNFNENNIIGSMNVSETGFNNLVNKVQINYGRNEDTNWQRGTVILESPSAVRYPNELDRLLTLDLPLVNNDIEAKRVATLILNQSRQQLSIRHRADATAMPLEAGDVVTYTDSDYGWVNKQFRIISTTEIERDGALLYDIESVEYAAAVYDETLNEDDVAPNVPIRTVDDIVAVNDLNLSSSTPTATVPSFTISWTVPSNSLIEGFDIYINSVSSTFTGRNTRFLSSVRPPGEGGVFTAGTSVSHEISGLSSDTYYLWVVGRNAFATSDESNTLEVVWRPNVTRADTRTVYRFHENRANNDPGAPSGSNGTGGGWQVESSDPQWQAVTDAVGTGGRNRVLQFNLLGTTGQIRTEDSDGLQRTQFTVTGTTNSSEIAIPASPSNTNYRFSGTAANLGGADPGEVGIYDLVIDSDLVRYDTTNRANVIDLFLSGNSGADSETPDTDVFNYRVQSNMLPQQIYISQIGTPSNTRQRFRISAFTSTYEQSRDAIMGVVNSLVGSDLLTTEFMEEVKATTTNPTFSSIQYEISNSHYGNMVEVTGDNGYRCIGASDPGANIDLEYIRPNSSGASHQRDRWRATIILSCDDLSGTDSDLSGAGPINVEFKVIHTDRSSHPTIFLRDTNPNGGPLHGNKINAVNIDPGISTSLGLRNSYLSNQHIDSELNVSVSDTERVIDGVSQPVLRISSQNSASGSSNFSVRVQQRGNSSLNAQLFQEEFGTTIGPHYQAHIQYTSNDTDSDIINLTFVENDSEAAAQIAAGVTREGLSASSIDNAAGHAVRLEYDSEFVTSVPTFTLMSGTNSASTSITTLQTGAAPTLPGLDATQVNVHDSEDGSNAIVTLGSNVNDSDAAFQVFDVIENAFSGFTLTRVDSEIRVVSNTNTTNTLEFKVIPGTNRSGLGGDNDLAITRTVVAAGQSQDVRAGVNPTLSLSNGTLVFSNNVSILDADSDGVAGLIQAGFNRDSRYTATRVGNVVTIDNVSDGPDNPPTVVINPGQNAGGVSGTMAAAKNVVSSGRVSTIIDGALSTFTILRDGVQVASGSIDNNVADSDDKDDSDAAQIIFDSFTSNVNDYSFDLNGNGITATSDFFQTEPDLTLNITSGNRLNGVAATLLVNKGITQAGNASTFDLTDATWDYFVITGNPNVDTDVLNVDTDTNQISVRRGLIVDVDSLGSDVVPYDSESHLTSTINSGPDPSSFVMNALVIFVPSWQTNNVSVQPVMEYSTDGNTWNRFGVGAGNGSFINPALNIQGNASNVGNAVIATMPINGMFDPQPNTTYMIRFRLIISGGTGSQGIGGWNGYLQVIEELRAT